MKLSVLHQLGSALAGSDVPADRQHIQALLRRLGVDPDSLYQELEMESRFVDTHQDVSYPAAVMPLHSHSFTELLCCSGSCRVDYLVGAERYRLQRGDIVLIPPGISHRPILPEEMEEPYRRNVLWLSPEFLEQLQALFPAQSVCPMDRPQLLRTAGTKWEFVSELFERGVREAERRSPGWEAFVYGNTVQLLVELGRVMGDRSATALRAEKPELLDRLLAYIEDNLYRQLTLADVARRFYISESTVSHIFKEKLGVSFYRCVTQRRLITAKTLIEQGCLLSEVCTRVGFADYSGFYRAFKQEYGISPRQYRSRQDGTGRK